MAVDELDRWVLPEIRPEAGTGNRPEADHTGSAVAEAAVGDIRHNQAAVGSTLLEEDNLGHSLGRSPDLDILDRDNRSL